MLQAENKTLNTKLIFFLIYAGALVLLSVLFTVLEDVVFEELNVGTVQKISGYFLIVVSLVYAYVNRNSLFETKENLYLLTGAFVVSSLLFFTCNRLTAFPFWLVGGTGVALFINLSIGLFYSYFFLLQAYYFFDTSFPILVLEFVLATICCFGAAYIYKVVLPKRREKNVFVHIAESEEAEQEKEKNNNGFSYLETVAFQLDDAINELPSDTMTTDVEKVSINASDIPTVPQVELFNTVVQEPQPVQAAPAVDYGPYCDETGALLVDLKTVKKSVFLHSTRIARVSEECAEFIGADAGLAKACGLYHEIGKLREGDVALNTVAIVTENGFPESLILALKECNCKSSANIGSKEAGIVSLADTIFTTYFFFKGQKKEINNVSIIDKAISKYMLNGRLNDSGLSVKECARIRDFFINKLDEMEQIK